MKKIFLISLLILAGLQLRAQQINHYYDYANSLYVGDSIYGLPTAGYYTYIFPDSTVEVNDNNGNAMAVQTQSFGQTLDPTDPDFSYTDSVLSRYISYTVSNLFFGYNYQRYQDAAPDTLLVQVYNESGIYTAADPYWPDSASYATVEYSPVTRAGVGAIYSQKLLLTSDYASPHDSIYYEYVLSVPVNISVPAGDLVAVTVTYFPGNPYSVGDTLDPALKPHTLINSFKVFNSMSTQVSRFHYNNELVVIPSVRYNFNPSGWDSSYIAGTAFGDSVYNMDMAWYITFDSALLSVPNIPIVSNAAIYPNPIGTKGTANLVFSLVNDNDLTIDIINDMGMKVLSYNKQHFRAGLNTFEINTANLPAGIYICNINGPQGNQSLKLAIQ